MNKIKIFRLVALLFVGLILTPILGSSGIAFAQQPNTDTTITKDDLRSIQTRTPFYDPNAANCSDSSSTTASGGSAGADGGSWDSGLKPPYILEQFAIETLKDVAAKRGVPETSTVTEEHVVGLIAFMFGEGGDIMNGDIFNPLNSGINAPELLATANAGDGLQSFKSFDAGVEATARTIVGGYQSRLADALVQPSSTAQDFMSALSYWYKYPGNQPWAEASRGNEDNYFQDRLQLISQVRSDYAGMAGLELGTPEHEQALHLVHPELLKYNGGAGAAGSSTGSSSSESCQSGGGASSIDPNLPSGTAQELISQINTLGSVTFAEGSSPDGLKQTALAVLLRLAQKYKLTVSSTIRPGGGPHGNGSAIDVTRINGKGASYTAWDADLQQYENDVASLLPSGSWMGFPNSDYKSKTMTIATPRGVDGDIDIGSGPHFHMNVPAGAP